MKAAAPLPLDQHNVEIERNRLAWHRKPVLQRAYRDFHRRIAAHVDPGVPGTIVELGSGIGNIRDVIPDCVRTDLFANPWIDQVENAYALTFGDGTVSHLILFDVFHHLQHPRTVLDECRRVLAPRGRVIIFDPYVSLAGRLVYGPLHHEPIGFGEPIVPDAPASFDRVAHAYYAAQGNATRVFWRHDAADIVDGWEIVARQRIGAWAYALTGGYSKPQLYPAALYPAVKVFDRIAELIPALLALRALVVLRPSLR